MNGIRLRVPVLFTILSTVATVTVLGLVAPAHAGAATPYCGITWGSTAEVHSAPSPAGLTVTGVRAGRHACYDRLVVDLADAAGVDWFAVRYAPQFQADGSGQAIALRGAADLQVVVAAPSYDANGNPTYAPANRAEVVNVAGFSTFRQVASGGSYEGYTTLGVGTRARLPFRVFTLAGPGESVRVVIDVAHRW